VYTLIVITITIYGDVSTQHVARFNNFDDCASFAVAWTDAGHRSSGDSTVPGDSTVQWTCEIEEEKP
jgi:hypothetical protein